MLNRVRYYLFLAVSAILMTGCYQTESETPDGWIPTEEQLDSISFYTTHHYSQNYNFVEDAGRLELLQQQSIELGNEVSLPPVMVYKDDRLVVADIVMLPSDPVDSVWVQVARDEETIGWIHESDMLMSVAPDNLISRFIDSFSDTHLLIMLSIVVLSLALFVVNSLYRYNAKIVHFRDINSFYPTLLALLVSASAVFYSTIQLVDPESWRHFYYHPTLNPFSVPFHLGMFLSSVWAILIIGIATLDDIRRKLPAGQGLMYFLGLAAVCSVDYVVFSVSTLYFIGYPLLVAYIIFALWSYFMYSSSRYICGNCGHPLHEKGICPHCGVRNV